jgi:Leucine-rich repeat (LRR) protein
MLGNERFAFETPNVIDPGDLPPSRPTRDQENISGDSGSKSSTTRHLNHLNNSQKIHSADSADEYNQARESAARLLRDIADLELNPKNRTEKAYDPYDEDDDSHSNAKTHSLPYHDARKQQIRLNAATSLLKNETEPLSLQRTVKLREGESSKNLLRNRILRCLQPYLIWIGIGVVAVVLIFASMAFSKSMKNKRNEQIQSDDVSPKGKNNLESSVRFRDLIRLLSEGGISLSQDLQTRDSPQFRSAYWIANKDLEQREFSEPLTIANDVNRVIQRYVLAVLYFATGGPDHWHKTLDFVTSTDECAWSQELAMPHFISEQYNVGVGCDSNLNVRSLFLPENGLIGMIPNEIRFLNKLNLISFPLNELSGSIPEGFGEMQDLLYLDLNYNSFTGSIPYFLGDYDRLQVLGLSNNQFIGSVPNSMGTLASMKTISLDDNTLTGSIDFIRYLENVEYVYLDRNKFTSPLNASFFESLVHLREIDLSDNYLEGELDLNLLFEHEYLHVIDLSNNNFTGEFPETIQSNNVLSHLSLQGNKFDGSIPSTIYSLSKLTHLDLQANAFTGDLPVELDKLSALTLLFLGGNSVKPRIPPLNLLSNLRQLSLTDMNLTAFPDWIDYMKKIELLDMSYNNISGAIDESIWNLPNLKYLILNDNKLAGAVPESDGDKKLMFLALHHNALTGDADNVCEAAPNIIEITTDCSMSCTKDCCKSCCNPDDLNCFHDEITDVMFGSDGAWELKYSKSSFSFDPSILNEASLFKTITTGVP